MDEQKLKAFLKDLMQPVFDNIVNECYQYVLLFNESFPDDMSDEEKLKQVEDLMKVQQKAFTESFDAVNINKIKEVLKNGK